MTMTTPRISNTFLTRTYTALTGRTDCSAVVSHCPGAKLPDGESYFANLYVSDQLPAVVHGAGFDADDARKDLLRDLLAQVATIRTARALEEHTKLQRCSVRYLRGEYERQHRVCDVRGMTKGDLVMELLRAKYGDRGVRAAYGLPKHARHLLEEQVVVPENF
jgi:ribosomal protein L32